MSRNVVARTTFAYSAFRTFDAWAPSSFRDVPGGSVVQGTQMRADDPIVRRHPEHFDEVDAAVAVRPSGPEWVAIVRVYRAWLARPQNRDSRPSLADIAAELSIGEGTLRKWLRGCHVGDFRDVHALVLSEP